MADDEFGLPLGAFISGSLIPGGEDLLKIEKEIEKVERQRDELSRRILPVPGRKTELEALGKRSGMLHQAHQVVQEFVRANPVSSTIYTRLKDMDRAVESRFQAEGPELAASEKRLDDKAKVLPFSEQKTSELTPEQKLQIRDLDSGLKSPAAPTERKPTELTPEQELEAKDRALAAEKENREAVSRDLPETKRAEKTVIREQLQRWLMPSLADDLDDGPKFK